MGRKVYLDYKGKKHTRHDATERYRDILNGTVADDVRYEARKKTQILYDKATIDEGKKWYTDDYFEKGMSFDDLPEEKKKNVSFLKGIELAIIARERSLEAYDNGVKKRIDGVKFKELSEFNQNNYSLLQGYWDARDQALIDGIDFPIFPNEDDIKMFNEGKKHFNAGGTLEEAPEEKRYNSYFIDGFMLAQKEKQEQMDKYDSGMQKFIEGVPFKDNPKEEQQNRYFVQGYRDARAQSLIDRIDWKNASTIFLNDEIFDDINSSHAKGRK